MLDFPVAAPPAPGETMPIAPGVRWLRMPLPFALNHINLWLLEDGPGWTIVDCGFAGAQTTGLWERIFAEGLAGRPVRRIIVTHYHPDHIGLAGWLAERWEAPLWITEKEWLHARMMTGEGAADYARAARGFARRAGLDEAGSEIFAVRHAGYRRGVPSVPPCYRRIGEGSEIEIGGRHWRVIIGEGHAPELACLYCTETGVLIAGDQILPKISPNISVPPHEPEGDPLARYLRSLDKLRGALPPDTLVLPSHNLPFRGVQIRIDELAAHHRERCAEVIAACRRPHSCRRAVADHVPPPARPAPDRLRARRGARPPALPRRPGRDRARHDRGRGRPVPAEGGVIHLLLREAQRRSNLRRLRTLGARLLRCARNDGEPKGVTCRGSTISR